MPPRKRLWTCSVPSCNNRSDNSQEIFARFPKDVNRYKDWVWVIGDEDLVALPISKLNILRRVCGEHFQPRDFATAERKRLVRSAVPSIFPGEVTPLPNEVLRKFSPTEGADTSDSDTASANENASDEQDTSGDLEVSLELVTEEFVSEEEQLEERISLEEPVQDEVCAVEEVTEEVVIEEVTEYSEPRVIDDVMQHRIAKHRGNSPAISPGSSGDIELTLDSDGENDSDGLYDADNADDVDTDDAISVLGSDSKMFSLLYYATF